MPDDEIRKHDNEFIQTKITEILQHWDSVQIFATRVEAGQTIACSDGSGNWYARFGQVAEWLQNGGVMHIVEAEDEEDEEDEDGESEE